MKNTKDKILKLLNQNSQNIVSGQTLAETCGISRTAVWKAINSLRAQGYEIEGTTNGGYKLINSSSFLSEDLFVSYLIQSFPDLQNTHVECFKTIDSTNTYAKKILSEGTNLRDNKGNLTDFGKKYHCAVFVAEEQTQGRGRLGRTFYSPAKNGIYLTVIYAPKNGIQKPAKTTAYSAVAVINALQKLYNLDAKIKWINDIFLNGKKLAGILTEGFTNFETNTIDCAIIGIGINVETPQSGIPGDIKKIATSITQEYPDIKINRAQLAAAIAGEVIKTLEKESPQTMKTYKEKSFLTGKTITVHPIIDNTESSYTAKVIDIDKDAALIVQLKNGTKKTLISGEVSLHTSDIVS